MRRGVAAAWARLPGQLNCAVAARSASRARCGLTQERQRPALSLLRSKLITPTRRCARRARARARHAAGTRPLRLLSEALRARVTYGELSLEELAGGLGGPEDPPHTPLPGWEGVAAAPGPMDRAPAALDDARGDASDVEFGPGGARRGAELRSSPPGRAHSSAAWDPGSPVSALPPGPAADPAAACGGSGPGPLGAALQRLLGAVLRPLPAEEAAVLAAAALAGVCQARPRAEGPVSCGAVVHRADGADAQGPRRLCNGGHSVDCGLYGWWPAAAPITSRAQSPCKDPGEPRPVTCFARRTAGQVPSSRSAGPALTRAQAASCGGDAEAAAPAWLAAPAAPWFAAWAEAAAAAPQLWAPAVAALLAHLAGAAGAGAARQPGDPAQPCNNPYSGDAGFLCAADATMLACSALAGALQARPPGP